MLHGSTNDLRNFDGNGAVGHRSLRLERRAPLLRGIGGGERKVPGHEQITEWHPGDGAPRRPCIRSEYCTHKNINIQSEYRRTNPPHPTRRQSRGSGEGEEVCERDKRTSVVKAANPARIR
jgi:hypothetical protein